MLRSILVVLSLLIFVPGESLSAQVLPGISESQLRAGRQQFSAEILRSVNDLMSRWKRAWESDAAGDLGDLYTDEAVVILPGGERLAGQENIRIGLEERVLPSSDEVITRQLDLAASGRIAVSSGRYSFQVEEDGFIVDRSGTYMMVFMQEGRHWRIRSQLFSDDGAGI